MAAICVALGVYDPKDLKKSIEFLFNNESERVKLLKKSIPYVKNIIACDGKEALEKTVKKIKEIIRE